MGTDLLIAVLDFAGQPWDLACDGLSTGTRGGFVEVLTTELGMGRLQFAEVPGRLVELQLQTLNLRAGSRFRRA